MVSVTAPTSSGVSSGLSMQLEQASPPRSPRSPLDVDTQNGMESTPALKGVSGDPPVSLKQDSIRSFSELLMVSESQHPISLARRDTGYGSRGAAIASRSHHSLGSGALTACSYQTMQQEYDKDTWRMYERIRTSRDLKQHKQESILYSCVCDAVEETDCEDFVCSSTINNSHYPPSYGNEYQLSSSYITEEDTDDAGGCESEGIFELDF